jgi:phosphatidylserine/phosphatidylglycerophosphate/cardiolipin synthase-like enzyme
VISRFFLMLWIGIMISLVTGCSQEKAETMPLASHETNITYSFTDLKGDPAMHLIDVINQTERTFDIAIYNFDQPDIAHAILKAKQRGVEVRIITDKSKADNRDTGEIFAEFYEARIPIKINQHKKMHLKLSISDRETIVVGSFNYTTESAVENQELLLSIQHSELAEEWGALFNEMWESEAYHNWTP